MNKKQLVFAILTVLLCIVSAHAQPGAEIEVDKPKKYENRKLGSEKTGAKKFTIPRKIYQNTVTHYNYYFNANNRLNEVVMAAKQAFKDDYSQLLPFYNYSLDATSQNRTELDSIIYKCTAGILLHDLRNSWIDNLYLLLAKAYFYRNDLDSAGLTLQYVNFAFAPKEEGGYDIPIGSNVSNDKGEFSIATKEKNSIFNKLTSRPPSRNESFIWQIRNHLEKNELPEAAGIIEILKNDPNFPPRLKTDLNEMRAYWFYKQQVYDSSAIFLSHALNEASTSQEKARWEYLIAQMYQLANKNEQAVEYYSKSITHTTDAVMDVYARLNSIRIQRGENKDYLQENINALLKMAKRDKYESYRDIIYYAAATIELERNNFENAQSDLLKSVKYSENNPAQRSQAFLLLADMNYNRQAFVDASNFYDSIDVNIIARTDDKERIEFRKPPLKTVLESTLAVQMQDSLQALAKLPAEQRDAIIKKQVKLLRKAQGLKEEDTPNNNTSNPAVTKAPDLFLSNEKSEDFYFYNASMKARGFSEFKARWGERANVDNWRRKSAMDQQSQTFSGVNDVVEDPAATQQGQAVENSYEGLTGNIPLTEEKLNESNRTIMDALFTLGKTFFDKLEEYPSAIQAYEELLRRFPDTDYRDEVLFNLIYAYQKTGDKSKADQYKNTLATSSPASKWAQMLANPSLAKANNQDVAATKKYEDIYNLFIEGQFERAKNEKKIADSLYGNSYWTPQLLFIEAIYYIKQKQDSVAIDVLTNLSSSFAGNPLVEKALTMIDVLKRRNEIEAYLANLDVKRNEDLAATTVVDQTQPVAVVTKPVTKPEVQPEEKKPEVKPETKPLAKDVKPVKKPEVKEAQPQIKVEDKPKKQPPVAEQPPVVKQPVDTPKSDIVFDTAVIRADSTPKAPAPVVKSFSFVASDPHYVVILLDKVDPVYASEARNAFNRYNREKYSGQQINTSGMRLNERLQFVLQGPFKDANIAMDYVEQVRPIAPTRVVPWLKADKFSFMIISQTNLDILKSNNDMEAYRQLLQKAYPGKF